MDLKKTYKKNQEMVYREEEDGAFLFDPETGNLKYMNRTGKEAFLMLNGRTDIDQVVDGLMAIFHVTERKMIEKDVEAFLEELDKNGFISASKAE